MKNLQAYTKDKITKLIIEKDENVGYYLTVYPTHSNVSREDYLCDSIEEAFIQAKKRYGVDETAWENIN